MLSYHPMGRAKPTPTQASSERKGAKAEQDGVETKHGSRKAELNCARCYTRHRARHGPIGRVFFWAVDQGERRVS